MIWGKKKSRPYGRRLTGVGATLSASHRDPRNGEVHAHKWEIVAWFDKQIDARTRLYQLEEVIEALGQGCLPDSIAWGEALAEHIARQLSSDWGVADLCVAVDVSRPDERIFARWAA